MVAEKCHVLVFQPLSLNRSQIKKRWNSIFIWTKELSGLPQIEVCSIGILNRALSYVG